MKLPNECSVLAAVLYQWWISNSSDDKRFDHQISYAILRFGLTLRTEISVPVLFPVVLFEQVASFLFLSFYHNCSAMPIPIDQGVDV